MAKFSRKFFNAHKTEIEALKDIWESNGEVLTDKMKSDNPWQGPYNEDLLLRSFRATELWV